MEWRDCNSESRREEGPAVLQMPGRTSNPLVTESQTGDGTFTRDL